MIGHTADRTQYSKRENRQSNSERESFPGRFLSCSLTEERSNDRMVSTRAPSPEKHDTRLPESGSYAAPVWSDAIGRSCKGMLLDNGRLVCWRIDRRGRPHHDKVLAARGRGLKLQWDSRFPIAGTSPPARGRGLKPC